MLQLKNSIVTDAGNALLASSIKGGGLEFTTVKSSDYQYPDSIDYKALTDLQGVQQSVNVLSATIESKTEIKVSANIMNTDLEKGYYIRQLGLYAKTESGEILFSVTPSVAAEWMPQAVEDIPSVSINVQLYTAVSSTEHIKLIVNPSGSASEQELQSVIAAVGSMCEEIREKADKTSTTIIYATGTNEIKLAIEGVTEYVDGQIYTFLAANNNTGNTTVQINDLSTKSLYSYGGTSMPTFHNNKAYRIWYNSANDCFYTGDIKINASLSSTSIDPVQNKAVYNALALKADKSELGTQYTITFDSATKGMTFVVKV